MSRRPASDICSVRGIGVADIEITSTLSFSWRSSSFCLTPKRCSSSTISSPRSLARTSRESTRWVPIRMSTRPSAKPSIASFCSAARAEARDVLERERIVGQALGERAVVLLGEDRRRRQHQHLLALGRRLEGGAQRHLGLAVADVAADQPVHRPRRLHVGLDQLDRLALVGGLGEREALLELPLPVASRARRRGRCAGGARRTGSAARRPAPARRGARAPSSSPSACRRACCSGGCSPPRADVARDLRELVGGHEDAVVALVFEVQVVARDARHGARLEAGEARDAVVLVHDDVAGAQIGERAQRAPAAAARAPCRPPGRRPARRDGGAAAGARGRRPASAAGATKPSRSEAVAKRSEGSSGWPAA